MTEIYAVHRLQRSSVAVEFEDDAFRIRGFVDHKIADAVDADALTNARQIARNRDKSLNPCRHAWPGVEKFHHDILAHQICEARR